MDLLRSLFESLEIVARLHEEIVNEDSKIYSLDPRNYLFNGKDKGDYTSSLGSESLSLNSE